MFIFQNEQATLYIFFASIYTKACFVVYKKQLKRNTF